MLYIYIHVIKLTIGEVVVGGGWCWFGVGVDVVWGTTNSIGDFSFVVPVKSIASQNNNK